MKAVILAAGKSTRTFPLTVTRPKPLLKVMNRTVIERNLEQLKGIVDEVIIIVGYMKDMIIEHLGSEFGGMKLTYVEQKKQLGTGHAVLQVKKYIKGKFLVMMGDDLYSSKDIKRCSKHDYAILGKELDDISAFGALQIEKGNLKGIIEKQKEVKKGIAGTGLYVFDTEIFKKLEGIGKSERGEIELTDALTEICSEKEVKVITVEGYWFPLPYAWSLLDANVYFLSLIKKSEIKGEVEENVTIKGNVIIGKGTIIKSGSYIEGPVFIGKNCEIGPNAHIRPDTSIGDNCRIGKTELYDDIIMEGTTAKHFGYIGHSVVGENVNIGAGIVTADYRHDAKNNITVVKGEKVDSGRRKLGAFIGDDVNTGIGTLIYPGRKIWPGLGTRPGQIVDKDITE